MISPDEVFILLSYIPFKNSENVAGSNTMQKSVTSPRAPGTPMRQSSTDSMPMRSRTAQVPMNQEQRATEQREIKAFVQQAFSEVKRFTLD